MVLFRKNRHGFGTKQTTDEPMTRAQLLDGLNNIAAEIRNATAMIERMNVDSDKTGAK